MNHVAALSISCLVLLTSCARVEIPQFTSVTSSADPVGSPVTSAQKIEELSETLRSLPGRWERIDGEEMRVGLAVVLRRDSRAVAQVVIGDGWLAIQTGDDRGPRANTPVFTKRITAADRERITRLATERPIQSPQHNAGSRPSSSDSPVSKTPSAPAPRG
jgi:hypothetical protein